MTDRNYCPLRHTNGNCLPIGESCTSVNDKICKALMAAYEEGKLNGILAACLMMMEAKWEDKLHRELEKAILYGLPNTHQDEQRGGEVGCG